jgi:hypothetical protein
MGFLAHVIYSMLIKGFVLRVLRFVIYLFIDAEFLKGLSGAAGEDAALGSLVRGEMGGRELLEEMRGEERREITALRT